MISIAVCSHNRSEDVGVCLAAVAPQIAGRDDELILVDSCSSGDHALALRALASQYNARFVRLERPGHSFARNAALRAASGDWIAYLDDDAVPYPDWLVALQHSITAGGSQLAALGGATVPLWPSGKRPKHIGRLWLFFLSCIEDAVKRSVRDGAKVCGANLAFHRESLLAVGGFRNELGRIGERLIGGEETLAVSLLLRSGQEVIYDPAVRVKHKIHAERLTSDWIRRRAYWEGVTEVAKVKALGERFPRNLALPKLAASASLFSALHAITRRADFLIRSQIARGALNARLKPIEAAIPLEPPKVKARSA